MKVLIAMDSFKESLTSKLACDITEKSIKKLKPTADIFKWPMADGGEGSIDILAGYKPGQLIEHEVIGPLGEKIISGYYWIDSEDTAVIEVAKVCGLEMLAENERNPLVTTSYGVGELISIATGC